MVRRSIEDGLETRNQGATMPRYDSPFTGADARKDVPSGSED
jgi:hypothetical protein